MLVARTHNEVSALAGCVLVPTMGALHEGHAALIARAAAAAEARAGSGARPSVVVTIFVNPTQFNDPADFARYPRTEEEDLALCARAGADAVFAPAPEVVYPPHAPEAARAPTPALPREATEPGLEDRFRPGHFAGVCQVVRRLFDLTRPCGAIFGEKDWQQLVVVRAMTARDGLGVEILSAPTVRERDGVAMSSRNRLLRAEDRARASAMARALRAACAAATVGDAERAMARVLADGGLEMQYGAVRDGATLAPLAPGASPESLRAPARALLAALCGGVRLIDNCAWPRGAPAPAPG